MKHTQETKEKLSKMRKGENNPFYGKKHTDETKAKMAKITRAFNANRTYALSPVTIIIPNEIELSYLAGIVDGEGSIGFIKEIRATISIYNTDENLMKWIVEKVGGVAKPRGKNGRKPCFHWHLNSARNVYLLCIKLLPFLIIKKEKAEKVITFLEAKYGDKIKY